MGMEKEIIFVVDDNRQIADFWAGILLPDLGYSTLVAYNGKTALEILRTQEISLMLLDLQLPDMSGLDVLRQIVREGHNVPTILVTAHGSEQIAVESFRLGVQDYLTKPVDAARLNDSLTHALAESRLRREKTILTAQLREQLNSQLVLARVGQSVTSSLDLDEVLRRIVHAGVQLTHAEEGFLGLVDDKTDRLYLRAVKNIAQDRAKTIRLPVNDSLVGEVLRTGKPARTTTQSAEDPLIKVSTGFLVHSLLHVPINSRGKPIGVLSVVNHSSQRPFKDKDESLLIALAGYASTAIDNARLYENAQLEITERIKMGEALRESEERYALAMHGANDGLWDWDIRNNQVYYSQRWKAMIGSTEDEIGQKPEEWLARVHPDDIEELRVDINSHLNQKTPHFQNEHRILHKDGSYRWVLSRGQAVWDSGGQAARLAGSLTDITERKSSEEKLVQDAFYDKLTGLPNRALFIDRLNMSIGRSKRRADNIFAVLFLDLDRFKDVNDSLGHMLGDQLLASVARILEKRLRPTDTVARFGGDEFVILLDDIRRSENATQIADWIKSALDSPIQLGDHEIYITASIGIVLSETGYSRAEDVLRDADIAMYHAKNSGKAHFEIFDPLMRTRIMERLELENDLRRAIENNELRVYYQLIFSLDTKKIQGFEALVRWEHPRRGLLLPKEFIPLAEETGLVIAVDRWVLNEACHQLKSWLDEFPALGEMTVSVNLSGRQFSHPDLVPYINDVIKRSGIKPGCLNIEITETIIVENREVIIERCNQIQALGVQVQIDDFGSGYSSLSYLSQFQFHAIKIDRSFIEKIHEHNNDMQIVKAIVALSHRLGMGVIAEGVETENQLDELKEIGCELGQGFFLSLPLTNVDATRYLVNQDVA
jgi:diguanylate cyclase (GGDEF)-like protein/PAS domain S-box-containing protein